MISRMYKGIFILTPFLLFCLYLAVGSYTIPFDHLVTLSFAHPYEKAVLFNIRLPRAIMAALFGAAMGLCGAVIQTVLRNPLTSPYILGISSGAAFGAALAMALSGSMLLLFIQPMAALFGLLAVALTLCIARVRNEINIISVILGGVIISALFTGLLSLVQILVAPEQTQAIVSWIVGRLNTITWTEVIMTAPVTLTACIILLLLRWRIFGLSMGDEEAQTAGIRVHRDRFFIITLTAVATASVVSVCGIIGWVCLISPHITRYLIGSEATLLLPASISVGISFMLVADLISRTIWIFEIPAGVITTIIGAPLFLYLMRRNLNVWRS